MPNPPARAIKAAAAAGAAGARAAAAAKVAERAAAKAKVEARAAKLEAKVVSRQPYRSWCRVPGNPGKAEKTSGWRVVPRNPSQSGASAARPHGP